jgi:hypothetical protein
LPDPTNCPVVDQAELASATAKSLVHAVKKLRRLQARCTTCAHAGDCPTLTLWKGNIDQALNELASERSKTP